MMAGMLIPTAISELTSGHPFGETMGETHHGSGPVGKIQDDVQSVQ
jgi:hypothetical protein